MSNETKILHNPDDIWEAIQVTTGEIFIYHKGFKEEADIQDVYKFMVSKTSSGQIKYDFSRFDFNPASPVRNSSIRLNRAHIMFAWYIDPASEIITALKKIVVQMNAKQAGLIFAEGV